MARSEARIRFGIWREGLDELSPHAKLMYLVVLTEPTVNHAGVGAIRQARWARNAGLTAAQADKAIRELVEGRFVLLDADTEEVFVRTLIRNDGIADQPNMLKGALREALNTASPVIRRALAGELRRLPSKRPDGVSKSGRPVVYPDPHGTASQLEPGPGSLPEPYKTPSPETLPEPLSNPSGTPPDDIQTRPGTPGGGGGGGGDVSSPVGTPGGSARATRVPHDFDVTAEMVAWTRERCPDVNGKLETERFKLHFESAPGAKGLKTDWVKTWKNWMLEEQKRVEQRRPAHLRSVSGQGRPAWMPSQYDDDGLLRDPKTGRLIER